MSFRSSVILDKIRAVIHDEDFEEAISERECDHAVKIRELFSDVEAAGNVSFEVEEELESWNLKDDIDYQPINEPLQAGQNAVFT